MEGNVDRSSFVKETRFASKLEDARSIEARGEGSCIGREIRIDQGEEGDGSRSSRLPRGHVSPKAVKSEGRTRPWGERFSSLSTRLSAPFPPPRRDNSCQIRRKAVNDRTERSTRPRKDNDPMYVEKGQVIIPAVLLPPRCWLTTTGG